MKAHGPAAGILLRARPGSGGFRDPSRKSPSAANVDGASYTAPAVVVK
jgi:hypothetical protein